MLKHHTAALLTLAVTAAALTACAGKEEPAKPRTAQTTTIAISYDELLDKKQISRSITLPVGDFLQVSLGSNPSTGFQWADKLLISDPKVLIQTGHEALSPATDRPGAPGSEVWMLQSLERGQTTVSTTYGRPWPGGEKDSWVFSVNVTVS